MDFRRACGNLLGRLGAFRLDRLAGFGTLEMTRTEAKRSDSQIVDSHASICIISVASNRHGRKGAIFLLDVELGSPVIAHVLLDCVLSEKSLASGAVALTLARRAFGCSCLLKGHGRTKPCTTRNCMNVARDVARVDDWIQPLAHETPRT